MPTSESLDLTNVIEHSLESTPDALTAEKVRVLKALGVGRISVGVQSMDPDQLRKSGRRHSTDCAREAAGILQAEGIDNFNLDVIVGLPDQTMSDVPDTRTLAHLNSYGASVEYKTAVTSP